MSDTQHESIELAEPSCRRRRRLVAGAILFAVAAIPLFYAIENWRGRRAWAECKQALEAKGEVVDWKAFIPKPLPAEQNILKDERMERWFIKQGNSFPSFLKRPMPKALEPFDFGRYGTAAVVVAEIVLVTADTAWPFGKAESRTHLQSLVETAVGPRLQGATGLMLASRPCQETRPVRLELSAGAISAAPTLADLLPARPSLLELGELRIEPTSQTNVLRLLLEPSALVAATNRVSSHRRSAIYAAADYLDYSSQFDEELGIIRAALRKPSAQIEADYSQPYQHRPSLNFVAVRQLAQMTGERTQAHLLLNQPAEAVQELAFLREQSRLLETRPANLVGAMIQVAIIGIYASTVRDGLNLRVWREAELIGIQQQLKAIHLLPLFAESLRGERAASVHWIETAEPDDLGFTPAPSTPVGAFSLTNLWDRMRDGLSNLNDDPKWFFKLAPRGWRYQNMVTVANHTQSALEGIDPVAGRVNPERVDASSALAEEGFGRPAPYTWIAGWVAPRYNRATLTLARNETLIHQALVVCALERHRLAKASYPDTLEELLPRFLDQIPHDLVSGVPLKYRRTPDGSFLLWSVGWDGKDDNGLFKTDRDGKTRYYSADKGDWVWVGKPPPAAP